jgi:hypothetical protein
MFIALAVMCGLAPSERHVTPLGLASKGFWLNYKHAVPTGL